MASTVIKFIRWFLAIKTKNHFPDPLKRYEISHILLEDLWRHSMKRLQCKIREKHKQFYSWILNVNGICTNRKKWCLTHGTLRSLNALEVWLTSKVNCFPIIMIQLYWILFWRDNEIHFSLRLMDYFAINSSTHLDDLSHM